MDKQQEENWKSFEYAPDEKKATELAMVHCLFNLQPNEVLNPSQITLFATGMQDGSRAQVFTKMIAEFKLFTWILSGREGLQACLVFSRAALQVWVLRDHSEIEDYCSIALLEAVACMQAFLFADPPCCLMINKLKCLSFCIEIEDCKSYTTIAWSFNGSSLLQRWLCAEKITVVSRVARRDSICIMVICV